MTSCGPTSCKHTWLIAGFGTLSTVCAVVQLVMYAVFLRLSCGTSAIDYIWVFTCLGFLNYVYVWHNCRLLHMLKIGEYSKRSMAASKVWFYSALAYLLLTAVQVFWWWYFWDVWPLVLSAISLPCCFVFFVTGTRRLNKLREDKLGQHRAASSASERVPLNLVEGSRPLPAIPE